MVLVFCWIETDTEYFLYFPMGIAQRRVNAWRTSESFAQHSAAAGPALRVIFRSLSASLHIHRLAKLISLRGRNFPGRIERDEKKLKHFCSFGRIKFDEPGLPPPHRLDLSRIEFGWAELTSGGTALFLQIEFGQAR